MILTAPPTPESESGCALAARSVGGALAEDGTAAGSAPAEGTSAADLIPSSGRGMWEATNQRANVSLFSSMSHTIDEENVPG